MNDAIKTAIESMCATAGKSMRTVSQEIGKAPTFIGTTLSRRAIPRVDTLAAIAAACGYKLQLVGHGQTIEIEG